MRHRACKLTYLLTYKPLLFYSQCHFTHRSLDAVVGSIPRGDDVDRLPVARNPSLLHIGLVDASTGTSTHGAPCYSNSSVTASATDALSHRRRRLDRRDVVASSTFVVVVGWRRGTAVFHWRRFCDFSQTISRSRYKQKRQAIHFFWKMQLWLTTRVCCNLCQTSGLLGYIIFVL